MIQTQVKSLGKDEHAVHVHVPQEEYDRVYTDQLSRISAKAKLPGFRPGKTPRQVIEQQFGGQLREDTISALVQRHYADAISSSGLAPAVQPQIEVPQVQPSAGLDFTLKVVTWPEVELPRLEKLEVTQTEITVTDADVQEVVDRLMRDQVTFEVDAKRAAQQGDELHIDFTGYINDAPFEGGRGEDVSLVLGDNRFIPGFEEALVGAHAGEEHSIQVRFPDDYQAAQLAGRPARFDVVIKTVGRPVHANNEDELARMVQFDSSEALRADIRARLETEAAQASKEGTRASVFDALLAARDVAIPEALVQHDMRETVQRVLKSMRAQGMEPKSEMFQDEALRREIKGRSERALKLNVLLHALCKQADLKVDDAEVDAELDALAGDYPEEQRQQFKAWYRQQQEQMDSLRDRLLQQKCVGHVLTRAKVKKVTQSLSEWQRAQEQGKEGNKPA